MTTIELPFLHRVDFKRKGDRGVSRDWLLDRAYFEIDEFEASSAPIVTAIDLAREGQEPHGLEWRTLPDGRLVRPILSKTGVPLSRLEQLDDVAPTALLNGGWEGDGPWSDHPLVRDIRFAHIRDYSPRGGVHTLDTLAAGPKPVRDWLWNDRDACALEAIAAMKDVVLVDGAPHRVAPPPVLRVAFDMMMGRVETSACAPPFLPDVQPYETVLFFRHDEADVALELLRRAAADPGLIDLAHRDAPFAFDDAVPFIPWADLEPSTPVGLWTLQSYLIHARQRIGSATVMHMDPGVLLAYASALKTCQDDPSHVAVARTFDAFKSIGCDEKIGGYSSPDLGLLLRLADAIRMDRDRGSLDDLSSSIPALR